MMVRCGSRGRRKFERAPIECHISAHHTGANLNSPPMHVLSFDERIRANVAVIGLAALPTTMNS